MRTLTTQPSVASPPSPATLELIPVPAGLITLERIGHLLSILRQRRGLTQLQVADSASVDPSYYSRVEHGTNMTVLYFWKVCAALDVRPCIVFMIATSFPDMDEGIRLFL